MTAAPHARGVTLLAAHCASFDPDWPTARKRLDDALGPDLARKLVFALSTGERSRRGLDTRAVFAA
jgi:hypothetical protein